MANVVLFIVLGILIIIHVVNCASCVHKHLQPYRQLCHAEEVKEATCPFTKAGILNEKGRISVDGVKKLFQPHVIQGRQEKADAFFAALQTCVADGIDTLDIVLTCKTLEPVRNLLKQALCEDGEK